MEIFFLWVNIIKIKKTNNNNFISVPKSKFGSIAWIAFSLKKFITQTVKEANIEDRDENLKINKTAIHVNINKILKVYDKAINTPK